MCVLWVEYVRIHYAGEPRNLIPNMIDAVDHQSTDLRVEGWLVLQYTPAHLQLLLLLILGMSDGCQYEVRRGV